MKSKRWQYAGLILGVKYGDTNIPVPVSALGQTRTDIAKQSTPTMQAEKGALIQLNRLEIIKNLQIELMEMNTYIG